MIATGGLLRINARRQDSLKNKSQKPHTHKKRSKKKRRSEVVVVKGKLKLFSISGLVAALGILVLLVGGVMAALGYWPRDGLFFSSPPQEGTAMASVSTGSSTHAPADSQEEKDGDEETDRLGGDDNQRGGGDEGVDLSLNRTENINGTSGQIQKSFLEDFLDRYLYSDKLKVFGPLIMGIGIFLFICANAVLHENRDKKTKVINLRDIYSTVIDLHSLRKPNASSSTSNNPLNGLINYVQSKSLETKPRAYPASLMSRKDGGGGGGGGGGGVGDSGGSMPLRQPLPGSSREGDEGDTVFSIYQEQPEASPPSSSSDRLSLPPSFSPPRLSTCWTSFQKEALNSFTLPLRHSRPSFPRRRHSARAGTSRAWSTEDEEEQRVRHDKEEENEEEVNTSSPPPLDSSTPPQLTPCQGSSAASSSLHQGAQGGSQALLLLSCSSLAPSHMSLSSLSHLLSSSSSTLAPPCRRQSLPCGTSSATGYSKLSQGEGESFESTESRENATSYRKFSNREKLRSISQVDSGVKNKEEG